MLTKLLGWLQHTPITFRIFFTLVITLMLGAFLFQFVGHDGIGALVGLAAGVALIIWKRASYFGPKLP